MFQSGVVSVRTASSVNLARERSRATSAGRPESLSPPSPEIRERMASRGCCFYPGSWANGYLLEPDDFDKITHQRNG